MTTECCPKPKFNKVTHVIFDLDGTLLDSQDIYTNAIIEIGAKYEKVFTNDIYAEISGCRDQDVAEKVISLLELPLTPKEFLELYQNIINTKLSSAALMPGAEKLIKHFHSNNIPMAVGTSSTQESFDLKTKAYKEIFDLFDHIVCGGSDPEVTRGKPFPDIFLICASRFPGSPDPPQCLVFEDAPNGVQAALSAGMQVVMIPSIRIPYDLWKTATLRLDSFEFMVPGAFGLPPFPSEEGDFAPINNIVFSIDDGPTEFPLMETLNIKAGAIDDDIGDTDDIDEEGSL